MAPGQARTRNDPTRVKRVDLQVGHAKAEALRTCGPYRSPSRPSTRPPAAQAPRTSIGARVAAKSKYPLGPARLDGPVIGLAACAAGPHNQGMSDDVVLREELQSAIEARKELGDEMEPAVIDAFVARIERRLVDRAAQGEMALQRRREHQKEMVLGSMAISIPLLAIAAIFTGLPGVIAVCAALVVIAIVSSRT